MNHQQAWSRLNDFVDGALTGDELASLEQHLAGCEDCRREVAEIRALLAAAQALPRDVEPPRDLWPAIAGRIAPLAPTRPAVLQRLRAALPRWPVLAPALATAAVVVLVLALGRGPHLGPADPADPADPAQTTAPGDSLGFPDADPLSVGLVTALEAECRAGEVELARMTATPGCSEKQSIVQSIVEEIRTIDTAIAEVKLAWTADPSSPQFVRLLASYYRAKAVLQGRATEVAARVTC